MTISFVDENGKRAIVAVNLTSDESEGYFDVPPGILIGYNFRFKADDGRTGLLMKHSYVNDSSGVNRVEFAINWDR